MLIVASFALLSAQILSLLADRSDFVAWVSTPAAHVEHAINLVGYFALLAGLTGLYQYQEPRGGVFGAVSFFAALFGTMLMAGDVWFEAFAVPTSAPAAPQVMEVAGISLVTGAILTFTSFMVGWFLFDLFTLRAGLLPRWLGVLIMLAAIPAFRALTAPGMMPLAAVLGIAGLLLWRQKGKVRAA